MNSETVDQILLMIEDTANSKPSARNSRWHTSRALRSTASGLRLGSRSNRPTNQSSSERPVTSFSMLWTDSKRQSGISREDFGLPHDMAPLKARITG